MIDRYPKAWDMIVSCPKSVCEQRLSRNSKALLVRYRFWQDTEYLADLGKAYLVLPVPAIETKLIIDQTYSNTVDICIV